MTRLERYFGCKNCGVAQARPNLRPFLCYKCKRALNPKYYKEHYYPRTYYRNRSIVLNRDKHQCQCCGTKDDLIIHHVDCNKLNNSPSNLITLCGQCHNSIHAKYSNKELRSGNIYKMFPKQFRWGIMGKRPIY